MKETEAVSDEARLEYTNAVGKTSAVMNSHEQGESTMNNKSHKVRISIAIALTITCLFLLPGCQKAEEKAQEAEKKAQEAAEYAKDKAVEAAEYAGELTANWLGTTAANVGKAYNKSVVERLKYLDITVDKIESENKDGETNYTIELSLNNSAPDNEKIHIGNLLEDHYLVACDQKDYTYSLLAYTNEDEADEYYEEYGNEDIIKGGKSRLTVYTTLPEADEISYLLFIDKKISLP